MKDPNKEIQATTQAQVAGLSNVDGRYPASYKDRQSFFRPIYDSLESKSKSLKSPTAPDRMGTLVRVAKQAIDNKNVNSEIAYAIKNSIEAAYAKSAGTSWGAFDEEAMYAALEKDVQEILTKNDVSAEDLEVAANEVSIRDNVTCNYQKRMLSFVHGAMIAAEGCLAGDIRKKAFSDKLMALYQKQLNKEELGPKDFEEFKSDLSTLAKKSYVPWEEISKGEYYANIERGRTDIKVDVDRVTTITEQPVNVQKTEAFKESLKSLQEFINSGRLEGGGIKNNQTDGSSGEKLYADMSIAERHWWKENINGVMDGTIPLQCAPAPLRNLPIPANFTLHTYRSHDTYGSNQEHKNENPHRLPPMRNIRVGVTSAYLIEDAATRKEATIHLNNIVMEKAKDLGEMTKEDMWGTAIDPGKTLVVQSTLLTPHEKTHQKLGLGTAEEARKNPYSDRHQFYGDKRPFGLPHILKIKRKGTDDNRAMKIEAQAGMQAAIVSGVQLVQMNFALNAARDPEASFGDKFNQDQLKELTLAFRVLEGKVEKAKNDGNPEIGEDGIFKDEKAKNAFKCAREAVALLGYLFNTYKNGMPEDPNRVSIYKEANPELYAACYAMLATQGMGGVSIESCKSSKDRNGMLHIYADAMRIYYERHGELPRPDDYINNSTKYEKFMNIAADVYLSEYSQEIASQNSYGAAGLKEGSDILAHHGVKFQPQGFIDAIERKRPGLLEAETKLAGTNKTKEGKIKKEKVHYVKGVQENMRFKVTNPTTSSNQESAIPNALVVSDQDKQVEGESPVEINSNNDSSEKRYPEEIRTGMIAGQYIHLDDDYVNTWAESHGIESDSLAWVTEKAEILVSPDNDSITVNLLSDDIEKNHCDDIALFVISDLLEKRPEDEKGNPVYLVGDDEQLLASAVTVCREYGVKFEIAASQPGRDEFLNYAKTVRQTHSPADLTDRKNNNPSVTV